MPNILPVNIGETFAAKTLRKWYGKAVTPEITNTDFESMAAVGKTDRVHILSFLKSVSLTDYAAGQDMSEETGWGDVEDDLLLDQKKYFNFEIDNLNKFEAYVNDLDSALVEDAAGILQQTIDTYVLGTNTYREVKVGHRVGSDALRGSIEVSSAGAVEATYQDGIYHGPFTQAMIDDKLGLSFDAVVGADTEGSTWYRLSAFTYSGSLTVTDWNGYTYTGGAKSGKAARIEAFIAKVITTGTIYA